MVGVPKRGIFDWFGGFLPLPMRKSGILDVAKIRANCRFSIPPPADFSTPLVQPRSRHERFTAASHRPVIGSTGASATGGPAGLPGGFCHWAVASRSRRSAAAGASRAGTQATSRGAPAAGNFATGNSATGNRWDV